MIRPMNQINESKDQTDENSPFGLVFGAYSTAFKTRDHDGLREAFHPDASVALHDRRTHDRLELAPLDFFTRLYREIGDAEFEVETLKSRFVDGYLFADGTWVTPGASGILRAADLFSASNDGRIASLTVVWMDPEDR